jgi:dienelactone hydrolase
MARLAVGAMVVSLLLAASTAHASDLIEERQFLRVSIAGRTVRLEALLVKRAETAGRLPVALINHGRPGSTAQELDMTFDEEGTSFFARDLARRGWLAVAIMRRGFGRSDGSGQTTGLCRADSFSSWMNSDADDLQAALAVIAKRPDADPTRVISLGHSAGGAASVALGARNPPGLAAVINLAGGEHLNNCPAEATIPADFGHLGSHSRVPNLWIFAKNDPLHPPAEVELMRAAFSGAGGDLKLVLLEPLGTNGHTELKGSTGRMKWLAELDSFLRTHGLPTWTEKDVDLIMQRLRLSEANRGFVESYFTAPIEKALVRSSAPNYAIYDLDFTVDRAAKRALAKCQAQSRPPCSVVMENDRWVGGP